MTRRAQTVLNIATCGVLLWILFGGSIFREPGTDQLVKGVIAVIVLGILIDLALRVRRRQLAATATPTLLTEDAAGIPRRPCQGIGIFLL